MTTNDKMWQKLSALYGKTSMQATLGDLLARWRSEQNLQKWEDLLARYRSAAPSAGAADGALSYWDTFASLSIATTSLAAATVGSAYSQTLSVTGGTAPFTWTLPSGSLPLGLTLNASTGVISGTPSLVSSPSFVVTVTDATNASASQTLSIPTRSAVSVSTSSLSTVFLYSSYSQTLAATGGTGTFTWAVTSGTLPSGLSLNTSTGVISGTPTVGATSTFTVTATDTESRAASKSLSITIDDPVTLSAYLWLDASDSSTITASSGSVSQWNDKSGNGRNFTQATSTMQPTTGTRSQNGRNLLDFTGDDRLASTAAASAWRVLSDGTNYVLAYVVNTDSTTTHQSTLATIGPATDTGVGIGFSNAGAVVHTVTNVPNWTTGVGVCVNNPATSNNSTAVRVITYYSDPDNATAADRSATYINAGAAGKGNVGTSTPSTGDPTYTLNIGGRADSTRYLDGTIGEIILLTGANATESNRTKLRDYLNAKWGVY